LNFELNGGWGGGPGAIALPEPIQNSKFKIELFRPPAMNYADFARRAHDLFDSIPVDLRGGVEYLAVERRVMRHPEMPDVYTLGECATGELELGDDFAAPTRSGIYLYWGSFQRLARDEPEFDWEGELWETLTHELRHHRESGAGEDALEDFDYAADENFKRREGEPFDPFFFRMGEDAGDGWRDVDGDLFLERVVPALPAAPLAVELGDLHLMLEPPAELGEVHFLYLEELRGELDTALVLVRHRGAWERLRSLLRPAAPRVLESAAIWTSRGGAGVPLAEGRGGTDAPEPETMT
jgi:hypothetical protein